MGGWIERYSLQSLVAARTMLWAEYYVLISLEELSRISVARTDNKCC